MEINTLERLKRELESFKLLTTANMVGAALTVAYSIAFGFTKIIPLVTGGPLDADYLPYLLVVISGFALAISWITRSAELMGEHDEIVKELDRVICELKSAMSDRPDLDENVIGILVRSLAFYRENSSKINRLKWGGSHRDTPAHLLPIWNVPCRQRLCAGSRIYCGFQHWDKCRGMVCSSYHQAFHGYMGHQVKACRRCKRPAR